MGMVVARVETAIFRFTLIRGSSPLLVPEIEWYDRPIEAAAEVLVAGRAALGEQRVQ